MLRFLLRRRRLDTRPLPAGTRTAIHIGMPKTATTMLQQHLFPLHSQIHYLGKIIGRETPEARYTSPAAGAVVEGVIHKKKFAHRDLPEAQRRMREEVIPAAGNKLILWSSEQHTFGKRLLKSGEANRFRQVFGEAKIVLVLRHPCKWAESMYFQKLKAANFKTRRGACMPKGFYLIDDWLSQKVDDREHTSHLEWKLTLDAYSSAFGRENVGVFLFEQMVEDSSEFLRRLAAFLGIDGEEAIRLAEGHRSNDRWSVEQMDRLKAVSASPESWQEYLAAPKKKRFKMLAIENPRASCDGPKARAEISPELQKRLCDIARPGARMAAELWGLPVEKYGYPV